MKPEEIALTPSLMAQLSELGIDSKVASMMWLPMADGSQKLVVRDPEGTAAGTPAFTLADILTMLPGEIDKYSLTIDHRNGMYAFAYTQFTWSRAQMRPVKGYRPWYSSAATPLLAAFGLLKTIAADVSWALILRKI